MNHSLRQRSAAPFTALALALFLRNTLCSQTIPTPAFDPATVMDTFTVSGVPLEEQVLPTVRPVSDVMGSDLNIVDTPRSVSSVNAAWMNDRMVKDAMDFGQFAPGVYSEAQYGIPVVPFIRGDLSQIYVGGQEAIYSRNSTPTSFNGVDSFDIVKGPGSAVYGPQGEGAGGYIDLVMKQPQFDREHLDADLTLGYWTSGHSYSNPQASVDFGGPISSKLAYRVSLEDRAGMGYYVNDHNQSQDLYAALTYLLSENIKIEAWTHVYSTRTNQIAGANRVTQSFIWNGTYIGGPASPATSGPNAYYGYDIIATPNPPPGTYGSYPDGSYSVVNPATAYTVKLPAYDAAVAPSDSDRSYLSQTQLKTTLTLSSEAALVNRTLLGFGHSEDYEAVGYGEYVPREETVQDRLELHDDTTLGGQANSLITGIDFRYTGLTSYQDYQVEPYGLYDLYASTSQIFYPGYAYEGHTWGGGLQVPGAPGYSATIGDPGNQMTNIYDTGVFAQDDFKLAPKLSLIPGYRVDRIDAFTKNPSFVQEGYYNSNYQYVPLASPVYIPAGQGSPYYSDNYDTSDTVTDQSFFLSLSYKLFENSSLYATYDHVDAILGVGNFGGVNGYALPASLTTKSTLYETGYKQSFLGNTLYASAALFQQVKHGTQITGASFPIKDEGLELETVYQPSKAWTLNANFTYQDATAYGSYFYQETGNYLDYYATTTTVDGQHGTGLGGVNFTGYVPPDGRMRAAGIPQVQANAFAEYKNPAGWGIGAGPQFVGRQDANDQGTLHIPGETELDGFVFYGWKTWEVRINVKNITNARLLDPIDVSYAGNDTIFVRPPLSASLTLRYHY